MTFLYYQNGHYNFLAPVLYDQFCDTLLHTENIPFWGPICNCQGDFYSTKRKKEDIIITRLFLFSLSLQRVCLSFPASTKAYFQEP